MRIVVLCILLSTGFVSFAQQPDYWSSILNNDRELALEQVEKAYKEEKSLEALVARQIVRRETGSIKEDTKFKSEFLDQEEYEMYLFSLWNEPYILDNYLEVGFDDASVDWSSDLIEKSINNQSLQQSVYYLKGITSRHRNNFQSYHRYLKQMEAIRNWQFCGPFENLNGSGIDLPYPPEEFAESEEDFNANSNGFLNWYDARVNSDGYTFFTDHKEYGAGVHYAQTFFNNPSEREVYLRLGGYGKMKVWINDVEVLEHVKNTITDVDAYNVKLKLPAGNIRLLVKVSTPNGSSCFIARLTDENAVALKDLKFSSEVLDYTKAKIEELNPVKIQTVFEDYFIEKRKENPENFLYTFCLYKAYMRNQRYDEAKEVIIADYEKYPNSSLLRKMMAIVYRHDNNSELAEEILENIELEDPKYYLSMLRKYSDVQELFRMSFEDMSSFLDEFSEVFDDEIFHASAEMIKALRLGNETMSRFWLNRLIDNAEDAGNIEMLKTYIPLHGKVLNDDKRVLTLLEKCNDRYFDMTVRNRLAYTYDQKYKREKVLRIYRENCEKMPEDIISLKRYVFKLHDYGRYRESLEHIDAMLEKFPYSFVAMELKGDALLQLGREDEAVRFYRESLIYNSGNTSLRSKIQDITNQPDIIEKFKRQDLYDFINDERGKITANNYGYNILLDEVVAEIYNEAGARLRYTYVYEITSQNGIDVFTEYNLGRSRGVNVIKSEVVKKNGSVVPGEQGYSTFVFNELEEGDVIYMDYEVSYGGSGRFYKDFVTTYQMNGFHPSPNGSYTLLVPKGTSIEWLAVNGEIPFEQSEFEQYDVFKWTYLDDVGEPMYEEYMPTDSDQMKTLHVSTIENWGEIARWYSDLVRSQMVVNKEVSDVVKEIFAGVEVSSLTDMEKAERIYYYIMKNYNYSFVSFRQSGFVPQKPARTIATKLGDCKDLSTLFVTLGKEVGLDGNLVLVLTADNGENALKLPSTDFNHCIVKVMLEGEEQFLELTNKHLPFMALPTSLINATALEIPYKHKEEEVYDLIRLTDLKRKKNEINHHVVINVQDDKKEITVKMDVLGASRTRIAEPLCDPNSEVVEEFVKDFYEGTFGDNYVIDSVYNLVTEKDAEHLSFTTDITVVEKVQKIGGFYILEVPVIVNAYEGALVSDEKRNYPLNYLSYEDSDHYSFNYEFVLGEDQQFLELPEDLSVTFKGHSYNRTYNKMADNRLVVSVTADIDLRDISVEEYVEFKSYVNEILEAKESFIGYK